MTLELTLDAKPEWASPSFANYLYANKAVLNDDLFVVESQRGDVLSRDVHTCYLTRDQTRRLLDEIAAFLGDKPGTRGCTCRFVHDLDHENEQLRQRVASLEKDNATLRQQKSRQNDTQYLRVLELERENAALKVDLMNKKSAIATILGDWHA